jgi:hypothetical protein
VAKRKRKRNFLGFGRGGLFSTSRTYHIDRSGRATPKKSSRSKDKDPEAAYGKYYERLSPEHKAIVRKRMSNRKRKRNLTLAIPRNKFINAKVRITSDGKVQALVSQDVLGHAQLGGSAKVNPRKRKAKRKTARRRKR